ncbi:Esterase B1 [Papilio xuthus]|uniref:Esterase B1 n=1 Tax=Papilio xuthus TaxID=66420 RepID=A0A194PGA7_PAPXU|nr:Esterase B1 [Papilio xuthus]
MVAAQWTAILVFQLLVHNASCGHHALAAHADQAEYSDHGDDSAYRDHGEQSDHSAHAGQREGTVHGDHGDHSTHADQRDRIVHGDHGDHSTHADQSEGTVHGNHGDHSAHANQSKDTDHGDHGDHSAYTDQRERIVHGDHADQSAHADQSEGTVHGDYGDHSAHAIQSEHNVHRDHGDHVAHAEQNKHSAHSDHEDPSDHGDHNGDHSTYTPQHIHSTLGDHEVLSEHSVQGNHSDYGEHSVHDAHSDHGDHSNNENHGKHDAHGERSVSIGHKDHNVQSGPSANFGGRLLERSEHIHATTTSGGVRGRLAWDGNYFAFLGIPYAAAPTGLLRLKAPRPPPAWNGTMAAERTVVCPQQGVGEEDCLVLNVFVPKIKAKRALPVLVYIHGGSFRYGAGPTRGAAPIVEQGVILVTMNYRLGPLGFLCLGIDEAPGNAGLQDQLAALRWVKTNIKNFGGDPNRVTIYGTDSGAACVELLVLSKASTDLFARAVIESGSGSATWAIDDRPLCTAKNFAKAFSVSELEHPHKLLELYQEVPASLLTRVNEKFANTFTDGRYGFAPCVERPFEAVQSVITSPPSEIMRKEPPSGVPLMFIFASLEGLFLKSREYYTLNYMNRMEANFAEFLPSGLNFDNEIKRNEKAAEVRRFYFAKETIENNKLGYLWYFGDSQILRAVVGAAEAHARRGRLVYLMEFAYGGGMRARDPLYASVAQSAPAPAGHAHFNAHVILNNTVQSDSDQLASDRAATLLCNFVKYGEPTPNVTEALPVRWPRLRPPLVPYLRLGDDLQLLEAPYSERIQFWKHLFYDFGKRLSDYEPYFC